MSNGLVLMGIHEIWLWMAETGNWKLRRSPSSALKSLDSFFFSATQLGHVFFFNLNFFFFLLHNITKNQANVHSHSTKLCSAMNSHSSPHSLNLQKHKNFKKSELPTDNMVQTLNSTFSGLGRLIHHLSPNPIGPNPIEKPKS